MFSKSTTCLLLTLLFITFSVPAFADGSPPPSTGDGSIHPWDNNDGYRFGGGPVLVSTGWMWLGNVSSGALIILPQKSASQKVKSDESRSTKATRHIARSRVATLNR